MLHHLTQNNSQEPPLRLRAPCWKSNTNSGAIAEPHYWECNTSSSLFGNTLHWDLINVATSRWVQTGAFSLRPCLWAFLFYFVFVFLHTLSDFSKLMQRRDVAISVRPAILPNIKKKHSDQKKQALCNNYSPRASVSIFCFLSAAVKHAEIFLWCHLCDEIADEIPILICWSHGALITW